MGELDLGGPGARKAAPMSSRAIINPRGIAPLESPLPEQMMSGQALNAWAANIAPVRPKPVMTSS